jgi:hypothetical protein
MAKLSVLIFSRNDIDKAICLIRDVYGIADEIVLIDSSDGRQREKLALELRRPSLSKVREFYAVALGYPDPLRTYALKKCRNRWVLLIDTDEKLSDSLKRDIPSLIERASCGAFAIRRYEYVKGGNLEGFTWQLRLFRKDRVLFRGIVHEQPEVRGTTERLDLAEHYLEHIQGLRGGAVTDYARMAKYERLTYALLNEMLLDYVYKLTVPEDRRAGTTLGRFVTEFLLAYERLFGRRRDAEISNFDYFIFYLIRDLAYLAKSGGVMNGLRMLPRELDHIAKLRKARSEPDGDRAFEISKAINGIGITRFLGLDRESTIRALNKKYSGREQGIGLLIRLLDERYARMKGKAARK